MELVTINGTGKESGKPFTGYAVKIGEYQTPMFFPSKIELMYIKDQLAKGARKEFMDEVFNDN